MTERVYPPTRPGHVEVKPLPEAVAFESAADEPIEVSREQLFRQNFEYLKRHHLRMTAPVETEERPGRIRFFYPHEREGEPVGREDAVHRVELPARVVVSAGVRGGYDHRSFIRGEREAREWLHDHPEWRVSGEPYAAYWNGPLVPSPLRKMEVHVPVEPTDIVGRPHASHLSDVPYSP